MGLFNTYTRTVFNTAQGLTLLPPAQDGPSLLRDWSTYQTLDHLVGPPIEFSRGSTATFTGSNGLIQSAANNAPRFDYDPITLACRGLLIEESRTNLLTFSEQFDNAAWTKMSTGSGSVPVVTPNAALAPNGSMNADRVQLNAGPNGSSDYSLLRQNGAYPLPFTRSIWVKSNTGSPQQIALVATQSSSKITVPVEWTRISQLQEFASALQFDISVGGTGATPATADILIWGAQLEAGAFATSYIPTTSASVTRAADVAQITGSNFSGMYNQNQGTLFYSARADNSGTYFYVASAGLDLQQGFRNLDISKTTSNRHEFAIANSTLYNSNNRNWISGLNKGAMGYGGNSFSASANGSIDTVAGVVIPTNINNIKIGRRSDGVVYLNGTISKLAYYRTRLTDAQLQALTA